MDDSQHPEPDDLDVSPDTGTHVPPRHRSRSRLSALGLVAAVVAALVAGPSVASQLASTGTGSAGTYPDLGQVAEEPARPAPTTTPDNANQREGRTVSPTPTSTGENANQREGRTWGSSACP